MGDYTLVSPFRQGTGTTRSDPMPRRSARSCLFVLLTCLYATGAAAQAVATNPGLAPAGRYRAVRDHTQIVFSAMHLGLSPYFGRISGATGTLTFSPLDPARSTVSIELDARSVTTMSDAVSRSLCADDAFACAKFPRIAFRSTAIR